MHRWGPSDRLLAQAFKTACKKVATTTQIYIPTYPPDYIPLSNVCHARDIYSAFVYASIHAGDAHRFVQERKRASKLITSTHTSVCVCVCVCMSAFECMSTFEYASTKVCVCVYVCVCVRAFVCGANADVSCMLRTHGAPPCHRCGHPYTHASTNSVLTLF